MQPLEGENPRPGPFNSYLPVESADKRRFELFHAAYYSTRTGECKNTYDTSMKLPVVCVRNNFQVPTFELPLPTTVPTTEMQVWRLNETPNPRVDCYAIMKDCLPNGRYEMSDDSENLNSMYEGWKQFGAPNLWLFLLGIGVLVVCCLAMKILQSRKKKSSYMIHQ